MFKHMPILQIGKNIIFYQTYIVHTKYLYILTIITEMKYFCSNCIDHII